MFIHGNWLHKFSVNDPETEVRFVFDLDQKAVVSLQVDQGSFWRGGSPQEIADLEDSLNHGNEEALFKPEDFGLIRSKTWPAWAKAAQQKKVKRVVAVIEFNDPEDNITSLSTAALVIESALGRSLASVDVTTFRCAALAAEDEQNGDLGEAELLD